MIGHLRGKILEKSHPLIVLDVSGVGYEVLAPMSTFYKIPELGKEVTLLTQMIVREDAQLLYGFFEKKERELFRALIKVNGVGPKLALTILSGMEAEQFVQCIQNNESNRLVSIPGIGKKTAERLIIETRDALSQWQFSDTTTNSNGEPTNFANQTMQDALSALEALGYKQQEAKRTVNSIYDADHDSETLIRLALKHMLKGV